MKMFEVKLECKNTKDDSFFWETFITVAENEKEAIAETRRKAWGQGYLLRSSYDSGDPIVRQL